MEPIRVLAISGSLRDPSHTRSLVREVSEALRARGAVVDEWSVADPHFPLADPYSRRTTEYSNADVQRFGELAMACHGSIWASPIYHNSYTGALKNALDILYSGYMDHKIVGLMSQGGNRATQAVDHLRIVARAVGALVIPTQVCTINDDYVDAPDLVGGFKLTAPLIQERVDRFVDEFLKVAEATRSLRVHEHH